MGKLSGSGFKFRPRVTKKTKTRLEGLVDLGIVAARKNPVVDNAFTAKEVYEAGHKIVTGKKPKFLKRKGRTTGVLE